MPSPFPGVDPYLEPQKWNDFHTAFITTLRETLVPHVRPQYIVDVERYVYVAHGDDEEVLKIVGPDVLVAATGHGWREATSPGGTATLRPVRHQIVLPRRRQAFLTIRTHQHHAVVTVIELLSPWNKARGAGQTEYLSKRANVLYSTANLVELDLLRGGQRLPTRKRLQAGQFYAFVSRPRVRPDIDVYAWTLRDPLPSLPIPLAEPDPDVLIDFQSVFTTTYDRAGYDYSLDYTAPLEPPLSKADAKWAKSRLP
jgi:hypothetical protein